MATRSAIGVMHGDNCKMVYCHWDGYLSHNGSILQKHYDSPKANNLVAMGNISSLKANIGRKHPFSAFDTGMSPSAWANKYGNMTTFYGRDREEEDQGYKTFTKFSEAVEYYQDMGAEFMYIMRDDVWYVTTGDMTELVTLETALKELETV
jgi:hypothetical protein